ncbi:MAG: putative lipid II flippase FtsW [bacterium]|nr:putative lipid II flippase FtsW [bacterium]
MKTRKKRQFKNYSSGLRSPKKPDFLFGLIVVFFLIFGVLMVYNASSVSALRDFGDKYYYLKEQLKWLGLGFFSLTFLSFFDYRRLYFLSPFLLISAVILLILVFIPGLGVKAYGASRWLNFRFFSLQPSEIAKLSLVIYLSAWFSEKEKGRLGAFLLLVGLLLALIFLQPDMGTAIILALTAILLYFLSGASLWHFVALLPASIIAGFVLIITSPYRFKRLSSFVNPDFDPLGASYHLKQILIALGSGGIFGVGLGQSRQKYAYLPESMTDSIFAIIGEEVGFIGAAAIVLIFLFFIWRGFKIAREAPDRFGQLLAVGIISWLAIQAFVNLSAMVALIPLTGVPLPFISYGGSSLVVVMAGVGILLNISRQGKALKGRNSR